MKPTEEQAAICTSQARVMKIKAGAGTGKTTTLRGLAARHRSARILYLAFNKAIKEEAVGKFVGNVRAMTAHGLAFSQVGKFYGNTPNKLLPSDLKPFHVIPALGPSINDMPKTVHNLYGGRVVETIRTFLVSPDMEMTEDHVVIGGSPAEKKYFSSERMLTDARTIWEQMQDLNASMPMIHDGYLKLFQLGEPELGYDMILLDEAQDTNPVTQALVEMQAGRRVYVGDEHQAIYGFRGARNAMALIEADEDHLLTGSFRFGQAVADLANAILQAKGETTLQLRGLGSPSRIGHFTKDKPHAFISRSNAALFARAVQALENNDSFAFVGPLYSYRLDLIEQAYSLSVGKQVNDPFLKTFVNFEALEQYGDDMEDREIQGRCRLVSKYTHRIPQLLARIQARAGSYPAEAGGHTIILTTAHRAKGLEFDRVQMADDFMDFFDDEEAQWKDLTQEGVSVNTLEQVNLQYVACTRAKQQLEIGGKLENFWQHHLDVTRKTEHTAAHAGSVP